MFEKITIIDKLGLSEESMEKIRGLSKEVRIIEEIPSTKEKISEEIGDSDCIISSWKVPLDREVLESCNNLKHICLGGTNSSNADLEFAKDKGITVSNMVGYGDEATSEYVLAKLMSFARGFEEIQWKERPCELHGKTLGIVGLGNVGKSLARKALCLGMNVKYYSKTRKSEEEEKGIEFRELHELIKESDVVSLHVPKNTQVFGKKEFDLMPKGSVLVNTCLGEVFNKNDFLEWIRKEDNFAIFDSAVSENFQESFRGLPNVLFSDNIGGITKEAGERRERKIIENLESFLNKSPINVLN